MTKEEFKINYFRCGGALDKEFPTIDSMMEFYDKMGREIQICDCGYVGCKGWKMGLKD